MDNDQLKLTSSEIGSLWGIYINGTMTEIVNKYMLTNIEDKAIRRLLEDAINVFEKQKKKIVTFMENEEYPIPNGFTETDLNNGAARLFTDIFCLQYLHVMTLHGLQGHNTSLCISVREDIRYFFDSCLNDAKKMYHKTIELLLEKGCFERDPYLYPTKYPEYISSEEFTEGFFGKGRRLAATEIMSLSLNIKKSILAKVLCIAFSQVAQSKEVREFLEYSIKIANGHIQSFSNILHTDNLPAPKSWESEITTSTESPFSNKLIMYHIGFLSQIAQQYYGNGLASAMRTDLVSTYEKTITRNLIVTKKWFKIMVKNKWLEQPPLAPNRKELAKEN